MSLCSLSRSDRIATGASCGGTESLNVCAGNSLPLHSSSLKRRWWWWWQRSICVPGLSTVPLPSASFHGTPITLLIAEYARSTRHCCFSLPATLQICIWDSFCSTVLRISVSPPPSHRTAQTIVLASCPAIFRPSRPSGTWTKCSPRVPPTTVRSANLLGVLLACSFPHGT